MARLNNQIRADRLNRLVANLLDLSRLEVGVSPDLKREPIELADEAWGIDLEGEGKNAHSARSTKA